MRHKAADCVHPTCLHHEAWREAGYCDGGTCGKVQYHSTDTCFNSYSHAIMPKPQRLPEPLTVESMLDEAKKLVRGDRQRDYEKPSVNFERIKAGWSVIFGQEITTEQFVLAMIWLKIAREVGTHKRDNWVDIAGYVEAYDWAKEDEDA